jgi:hypothetical protein
MGYGFESDALEAPLAICVQGACSMPEDSAQLIVRRLERLERQNLQLKVLLLAIACVVVTAGFASSSAFRRKSIEAQSFYLKDKAGHTRAALDISDGSPCLMFWRGGSKEKPGIQLCQWKEGPILILTDTDGIRTMLRVTKEGGPALTLSDRRGYSATLGVNTIVAPQTGDSHTSSAASLVMFDRDHKVIWAAPGVQ